MASRRVSRETTSKYFTPSSTVPPRRSTRASLARLAGPSRDSLAATVKDEPVDLVLGSDIEDAITTRPRRTKAPPPRKRKRETAAVRVKPERDDPSQDDDAQDDDDDDNCPKRATSRPAARRERKPARAKPDGGVEPPSNWEEMYELVKQMRISGPAAGAAVDTMGCERLASASASARDRRFHTLIALMLSSQTKDTVNAAAMARLKAELPPCRDGAPPGLNLENILAVDPVLLNELIWQVGFHNNKTKYIKQAAEILRDQHGSDIPDTIAGLMALPGVGPKMAHLCMSAPNGWDRVEGIGVDVHVHRITNLWGWNKTANPEATRAALEAWLPRDRWREINWLLVGLGQTVCLPVGRRCGDCELGLRGLCRAADRKKVNDGLRRREEAAVCKEEPVVSVKEEEPGEEFEGGAEKIPCIKNELQSPPAKKRLGAAGRSTERKMSTVDRTRR